MPALLSTLKHDWCADAFLSIVIEIWR